MNKGIVVLRQGAAALVALFVLGACSSGSGSPPPPGPPPPPPPPSGVITGQLSYEYAAAEAACDGLFFSPNLVRPIRQATVELIDASNDAVIESTVSDDSGNYQFGAIDSSRQVFVRVRAELKRAGSPSWDVEVRDNTSMTTMSLDQRPMYVLDGSVSTVGAQQVRDMTAATGWDGTTFADNRSAAPFSILDAIYTTMQVVLEVDPDADFPPLDAFWSVNNSTSTSGSIDTGDLGSSFYNSRINSLFLLGLEGDDIEEFDVSVIAHEWGHYFEDNFSRSDSVGGPHGFFDRLDPRLALGEGFATALAGLAYGPQYCDAFWGSGGTDLTGFRIDIEGQSTGSRAGWYNEFSVMKILYDLADNVNDGNDIGDIGWLTMYDTLRDVHRDQAPFTTIFSLMEALKTANPADTPLIDTLLSDESINPNGIDRWGSTETNDANQANILPVYTDITPNGTPINICSSTPFDSARDGNKLGTYRYLRMNVTQPGQYTFNIQADAATLALMPPDDPLDPQDQSDPDMLYFLNGGLQNLRVNDGLPTQYDEGLSGDANSETFTSARSIPAGLYVIEFHDFRYQDEGTASDYPATTCFDFSVTPVP